MQEFVIDVFAFCRAAESSSGSTAIASLARLTNELTDTAGALEWQLQGSVNEFGHACLDVQVRGQLTLICQRCLTPYVLELDSDSRLVLVKDEETADEVEELLDDDSIDVVVGSKAFNIIDLIEDEALLAIPQSPKHTVCPDQTLVASATVIDEEAGKPDSPFAKLKQLNGRT